MTLRLNGSSSGFTEINAPAAAGSNTITLPTSNGSANQYLATVQQLELSLLLLLLDHLELRKQEKMPLLTVDFTDGRRTRDLNTDF